MRPFLLTACLLFAICAQAQSVKDFVGRWHIDPSKVESKVSLTENPPEGAPAIPPPPPADHEYTLEHIELAGEVLRISGGEAGTTAVYTIDPSGKQVSDPIPDAPGSVRVASTRWRNGKLVTEWKMMRNGEEFMHGSDTRSITSEGLQVLERKIESQQHKAEVRLVMEKVH